MIDNQEIIIGQNEEMLMTVSDYVYGSQQFQGEVVRLNSIIISLIIVSLVILFWFRRRRTKWM